MKILPFSLGLLFVLPSFLLFGQCPPSTTRGKHVIQEGENLYRLSLQYKVSLENIYKWNNISPSDMIVACKELWVSSPPTNAASPPSPTEPKPANPKPPKKVSYQKQSGGLHVLGEGETIAGVANLYGYTEARFRNFNQLSPKESLPAGSVVLSSDCACGEYLSMAAGSENNTYSTPTPETNMTLSPPIETPVSPPPTKENNNIPNNQGNNATVLTAETTYLNSFEKEMVQEINLIRKDPSGYIPYILEYIQYMEKNGEFGNSIATANELVSALNQTPALDTLVPLKCLFDAAKKHAIDQKPTGDINHQGRDGLWPWDRALKACEDLTDGNENIVAGPPSVRRAVITLLVDDGIATRGHRANLLNPNWKYIACHQVGEIAGMPNYWIQMFGK